MKSGLFTSNWITLGLYTSRLYEVKQYFICHFQNPSRDHVPFLKVSSMITQHGLLCGAYWRIPNHTLVITWPHDSWNDLSKTDMDVYMDVWVIPSTFWDASCPFSGSCPFAKVHNYPKATGNTMIRKQMKLVHYSAINLQYMGSMFELY